LEEPNPYSNSGNQKWKDDFVSPYVDLSKDAGGSVNMVPWSLFGIGIYYNKGLFEKAGISELPKTWNEFMSVGEKLKQSGVIPWAVALKPSDAQTAWPLFIMHAATTRSLVPEVNLRTADGWNFDANNPLSVQGETIGPDERYVAFKKGLIDPAKSKAMADPYRVMKQAAQYMNSKDFLAIEGGDAINKFVNGESAMLYQGTWYLPSLQTKLAEYKANGQNDKVFEFGIFPFPQITNENTDTLTMGGVNQLGGLRNGFMVKKMDDENKTKIAIDFLKFITSPQEADKLFQMTDPETGFRYITDISTVQGVAPMPGTEEMQPKQEWADMTAGGVNYDQKDWDEFWVQWQQYLTDRISEEQFLAQRSKSNLEALERNLKVFEKDVDQAWIEEQLQGLK
jgi:ABC-type glycerol-3-phosphate transport system substrate-binding protein